jgi:hypothetical protein
MKAETIEFDMVESSAKELQILLTGRPFLKYCSYGFFWSSCDSARRNVTNFSGGRNGLAEQIKNNCSDGTSRRSVNRTTKDLSKICNLSRVR